MKYFLLGILFTFIVSYLFARFITRGQRQGIEELEKRYGVVVQKIYVANGKMMATVFDPLTGLVYEVMLEKQKPSAFDGFVDELFEEKE